MNEPSQSPDVFGVKGEIPKMSRSSSGRSLSISSTASSSHSQGQQVPQRQQGGRRGVSISSLQELNPPPQHRGGGGGDEDDEEEDRDRDDDDRAAPPDSGSTTTGAGLQEAQQSHQPQPRTTTGGRPFLSGASGLAAREVEELKIKLRLLESRRTDDLERIRSLELRCLEGEGFREARGKLQAKFAEMTGQLTLLRRENRDLALEKDQLEQREGELMEQLEMSMLDKEVAEEKVEGMEEEVGGLRETVEVLKVEIEVLKEENGMSLPLPV